jgi:hypothetical protein
MANIFKRPGVFTSESSGSYVPRNRERETLIRIIKRNPEIFQDSDIYLDEELKILLKKSFRDKRLNKLLDK